MKAWLSGVAGSVALCAMTTAVGTAAAAHPVKNSLQGGTDMSVSIDSPTDGTALGPGPATVSGTAAIGEQAPEANAALVYVLDVSSSTASTVVPACGGDLLDCEIVAAQNLNAEAIDAGTVGAVGAVAYGVTAAAADVTPGSGDDPITGPATDADGSGDPDVEQAVSSISNDGNTGISLFTPRPLAVSIGIQAPAITSATAVATDPDNSMDRTIAVFVSDGIAFSDVTDAVAKVPDNVDFFTFAVGRVGCGSPQSDDTLAYIADQTGGICTEVRDAALLPQILPNVIIDALPEVTPSELTSLSLRVDNGPAMPITDVTPALPHNGPVSVNFTVDTAPLELGIHTLCVTASGTDAGGAGEVTDCHQVVVHPSAEAFAVQATGPVTVPKTPHATCPPDESLTEQQLYLGYGSVSMLQAECAVSIETGDAGASAAVDSATLLHGAIRVRNIESNCVADENGVTGTSAVGTINGKPIGTMPGSITIPLATVHYNQTTTGPDGELVQTAIRVQRADGQEIIIASCSIG